MLFLSYNSIYLLSVHWNGNYEQKRDCSMNNYNYCVTVKKRQICDAKTNPSYKMGKKFIQLTNYISTFQHLLLLTDKHIF